MVRFVAPLLSIYDVETRLVGKLFQWGEFHKLYSYGKSAIIFLINIFCIVNTIPNFSQLSI